MSGVRDEFQAIESASSSAPLGWRLSMALCNLLIGATILAFAGIVAYEYIGLF